MSLPAVDAYRMVRTNDVVEDKPVSEFTVELINVIQQGALMLYREVHPGVPPRRDEGFGGGE